jgi:hypothetical protein
LEAPPGLQRIVTRCLARDPELRFQTMADVGYALQHLTEESPDVTASIAVLPFANLSADRVQRRLVHGERPATSWNPIRSLIRRFTGK